MIDYFSNLTFNLLSHNYIFSGEDDFNIKNTKELFFYKIENGSFVLFHAISESVLQKDIFQSKLNENIELLKKDEKNFKNIFFVTLIICDDDIDIFEKYSLEPQAFSGQKIYPIYWAVNLNKKELIYDKNQPNDIFNLNKIILDSYENKKILDEVGTNISDYKAIAKNFSTLKEHAKEPLVTYILIILNILYFGLMELNGGTTLTDNLIKFGAFEKSLIFEGEIYRFITSCFIHIGFSHLFYNMFALYIYGQSLEKYLGHFLFLAVYIFSGIFGDFATLLFMPGNVVSAGASGCIYGLVGCIGGMSLISRNNIRGFSFHSFIVYISITVIMGFFDLRMNNAAHLGGALFGFIAGIIIELIKRKIIEKKLAQI